MDTKKILYRLLNGKTPVYFTEITLVYEIPINNKNVTVSIGWYKSDRKDPFKLYTPNRNIHHLWSTLDLSNSGKYLNYTVTIDGHTYNVELDDVETDEVNLLVSKVMKEFQEKMFDDIGKSFFDPDPVYGDLLSDEK